MEASIPLRLPPNCALTEIPVAPDQSCDLHSQVCASSIWEECTRQPGNVSAKPLTQQKATPPPFDSMLNDRALRTPAFEMRTPAGKLKTGALGNSRLQYLANTQLRYFRINEKTKKRNNMEALAICIMRACSGPQKIRIAPLAAVVGVLAGRLRTEGYQPKLSLAILLSVSLFLGLIQAGRQASATRTQKSAHAQALLYESDMNH